MHELPRLKWVGSKGQYVAYPLGHLHADRCAKVQHLGNLSLGNETFVPRWRWAIQWPGWFSVDGHGDDKQDCADQATAAWWKAVASPLPRDVHTEIDMIAARVLIMPPPNSLYSEDSQFLRDLMATLRHQYEAEIRAETLPEPVRNLMASLSAELFRRRQAGDRDAGTAHAWSVT